MMKTLNTKNKTPEVLTWVFFASQGLIDNTDLMRAMMLCTEICFQADKATIETIKKSTAYVGAVYDLPNHLLTDEKLQQMINWNR